MWAPGRAVYRSLDTIIRYHGSSVGSVVAALLPETRNG